MNLLAEEMEHTSHEAKTAEARKSLIQPLWVYRYEVIDWSSMHNPLRAFPAFVLFSFTAVDRKIQAVLCEQRESLARVALDMRVF